MAFVKNDADLLLDLPLTGNVVLSKNQHLSLITADQIQNQLKGRRLSRAVSP